jgi:hypothetical protein
LDGFIAAAAQHCNGGTLEGLNGGTAYGSARMTAQRWKFLPSGV